MVHLLVVEEVSEAGQVLLLRGCRKGMAVLVDEVMIDVVADDERCDLAERQSSQAAPAEESIHGSFIRLLRVGIADLRLEEVGVGVLGVRTGLADDVGCGDLAN